MKAASLSEIKKELTTLDQADLERLLVSLSRFKKENKELLTYLLFEANDEQAYIENVKLDLVQSFQSLPKGNVYFVKKNLRKILRFLNKQIKYSGLPETELELRIYFCQRIREAGVPLHTGTMLFNLYEQQLKKIRSVHARLAEDLQFDYERKMKTI
jgi:hypothetical protein